MKYRWKPGSRVKVNATVAHRFLERVRKDNDGVLDLDDAVHKSKPKNAPLHNELEWSDAKCGTLHRREQMRYITRSLEVIRPEMPKVPMREYESIEVESEDEEGNVKIKPQFMRVEDILADPAARAELISRAIKDALAFRKRYVALSELATLIQVMDREIDKLAKSS